MRKNKLENKLLEPANSKEEKPTEKPGTVRVEVRRNRAVTGIGGEGAKKRISSELADELASQGLVTIL